MRECFARAVGPGALPQRGSGWGEYRQQRSLGSFCRRRRPSARADGGDSGDCSCSAGGRSSGLAGITAPTTASFPPSRSFSPLSSACGNRSPIIKKLKSDRNASAYFIDLHSSVSHQPLQTRYKRSLARRGHAGTALSLLGCWGMSEHLWSFVFTETTSTNPRRHRDVQQQIHVTKSTAPPQGRSASSSCGMGEPGVAPAHSKV